jgi:hypothetical protein
MTSEPTFETIRIPSALFNRIAEKLTGSEFKSVEDWVVKLLESEVEPEQPSLSERDEANIRDRLKVLGYE